VALKEIASMRVDLFRRSAGQRRPARTSSLVLAASIAALSSATGCLSYPDSDERLDDEIIVTHYKDGADFGEYATFAISPDIVVFDEEGGEVDRELLDEVLAKPVIENVVEHMTDRGYTQVTNEEDPDLGITVSVLSGTVTTFYTDYWGYYWGYPYYPYYPYYYVYSYNTGTVVVDTADLKNAPPPEPDAGAPLPPRPGGDAGDNLGKLDIIWTGLVYGVLYSTESQNVQRAVEGIDTAFKQSPYFRTSDGD
jgi:Domain of unknown function (DUF4136)